MLFLPLGSLELKAGIDRRDRYKDRDGDRDGDVMGGEGREIETISPLEEYKNSFPPFL